MRIDDINSKAYDHAMKKLAVRDRTRLELMKSLKELGVSEIEIDDLIYYLEEYNYVNHNNYVKQYIRYGLSKKWGLYKIFNNLKEKGIEKEELEQGIFDFEEEENLDLDRVFYDNARSIAQLQFENIEEINEKIIGKVGRKLIATGYKSEVVYKVIGEFL